MAIPGNVGMKKTTFSSPAAMAQAQRSADAQSMKALQDRREQTRQDFFKGRPDISDNRLDRRQIQSDLYEKFKQEQMRPVVGASNLYQSRTPGGKTLAQYNQDLATKYGPTLREIGSDIGYGLGNLARGFGDFISKGGAIGNVISDVYNRFKGGTQQGIETVKGLYDNLRTTLSGQPTVTYGGGSTMVTTIDGQPRVDLTPNELSMYKDMSPSEMGIFNTKINEGSTPREALAYVRKVNSGYYLGNYPELMQMDYPFLPSVLKTSSNVPTTAELPSDFQMKQKPPIPDQFRNIGDESDPSIFGITNTGVPLPFLRSTVDNPNSINVLPQGGEYLPEDFSNVGIENPLFRDINYDPIKINNMDMSGVNNLQLAEINPQQRNMLDQYLFDKMIQEEINRNKQQNINRDMQMFQTDPVNQPVLFAKSGGSVDKYAGLGYKLK